MAISTSRQQLEKDKFVADKDGKTAVRTTATITGDINVDNTSLSTDGYIGKPTGQNGDFVTAYTSAETITFTSLPTGVTAFFSTDIVSVQQISVAGEILNTYTRDDALMTMVGDVLTVVDATFGPTDTFIVYTNVATVDAVSVPTHFRSTAVDEVSAQVIKNEGGYVYGWNIYNPNGTDIFAKIYNTVGASVTVGTTVIYETIQVPALGSVMVKNDNPIMSLSTGISIAATGLIADNDTTALGTDAVVHVYYK